jgi:hypothetical protein
MRLPLTGRACMEVGLTRPKMGFAAVGKWGGHHKHIVIISRWECASKFYD